MTTAKSPGARWWNVDIHAHSPASFDFGGLEGATSTTDKPSYEDWLLAYMRAGLDGLVVTDHNSHEGIEPVRNALQELESKPDFRKLVIFPGVEITTHGGYHLLAIFDPSTSSDVINGLLHKCEYTGTRGDSNGTTEKPFEAVAEIIAKEGGIAVPAHADANQGAFRIDPRDFDRVSKLRSILAAEITTEAGKKTATKHGWVPVLGSDAHHLDGSGCPPHIDAKYPGSHFTWFKAEKLDLAGLRLALTDGPDSVIPTVADSTDPNTIAHPTISNITVRSRGRESTCWLNPWMNSLIGGRGVGKSTVVELLRLVMRRSHELPTDLAEDLRWFSPESPSGDESRFWDADTSVSVEYLKEGRSYRLSWVGTAPHETRIEVEEEDGSWNLQSGDVADRFPIQVYSQKQIYETARHPQSLLQIIDAQTKIEHTQWENTFAELCTSYRRIQSGILELEASVRTEGTLRGQLADVEAKLERLSTVNESPELAELSVLERYQRAFESNEHASVALADAVEHALTEFEQSRKVLPPTSHPTDAEATRESAAIVATQHLSAALKSLRESESAWQTARDKTPIHGRISELRAWLTARSAESGIGVGEDLSAIRDAKQSLDHQLAELVRKKARIAQLTIEAKDSLSAIEAHRSELSKRRKDYLADLANSGLELRINLYEQGDTQNFESSMRELLQKDSSFNPIFSGEKGLILGLKGINARDPKYPSALRSHKDFLIDLVRSGRDSALLKDFQGFDAEGRFFTHLEKLDPLERETEINLWFPEDQLQVLYKPDGSQNFKNVDEGSPGQKTAALLALVLKMGTEPLVLDQPEDDLENRLVFDLVVQTLRTIKTTRQIVVATHNANIVVNADSENVMVLQHGDIPEVEASGTIQVAEVKDAVCKILEGGETAIQARYERLMS